jgi:hypothetical protein
VAIIVGIWAGFGGPVFRTEARSILFPNEKRGFWLCFVPFLF